MNIILTIRKQHCVLYRQAYTDNASKKQQWTLKIAEHEGETKPTLTAKLLCFALCLVSPSQCQRRTAKKAPQINRWSKTILWQIFSWNHSLDSVKYTLISRHWTTLNTVWNRSFNSAINTQGNLKTNCAKHRYTSLFKVGNMAILRPSVTPFEITCNSMTSIDNLQATIKFLSALQCNSHT